MRCLVLPDVIAWHQCGPSRVALFVHHVLNGCRPPTLFRSIVCLGLAQRFSNFDFEVRQFVSLIIVMTSVEDPCIDYTNLNEVTKEAHVPLFLRELYPVQPK